jgi:hypothetical protein
MYFRDSFVIFLTGIASMAALYVKGGGVNRANSIYEAPSLHIPISVFVVLDSMSREHLAPNSTETNRHSLRSLWDKDVDYWDISPNHSCGFPCEFHTDESAKDSADGILVSAQLFPTFSLFFDAMKEVVCNIYCNLSCTPI